MLTTLIPLEDLVLPEMRLLVKENFYTIGSNVRQEFEFKCRNQAKVSIAQRCNSL